MKWKPKEFDAGKPLTTLDELLEGGLNIGSQEDLAEHSSAPITPTVSSANIEEMVKALLDQHTHARLTQVKSELLQHLNAARQDILKCMVVTHKLEVKKWDGTTVHLEERFHKQLPEIVQMLQARNAQGWSEFMYIHGAPGAGKTYMTRQMAKILNVPYFVFPGGPTVTEGKMLGFNNIANGTFVKGWLYDPFKNGGIAAIDEGDLCDGSVFAATNSIEGDEYMFGNGELVKRHRDFYLVVYANTLGTGATAGFTRNRLDAATLDRLTPFELHYDEDMEKTIYGNEKWAVYVLKVRDYVKRNMNGSIYITPRAVRKGAAYLAAGMHPDRVSHVCLFGRLSAEQKQTILANVGRYQQ